MPVENYLFERFLRLLLPRPDLFEVVLILRDSEARLMAERSASTESNGGLSAGGGGGRLSSLSSSSSSSSTTMGLSSPAGGSVLFIVFALL